LDYDYSTFKLFPYKYTEVGQKAIYKNLTVKQIKEDLIRDPIVQEKFGNDITTDQLLLREHTTGRPTSVKYYLN
jgi:hypothetical protein